MRPPTGRPESWNRCCCSHTTPRTAKPPLDRLSGLCRRLGIDAEQLVRVTDHFARATVLAANDLNASLVIAACDAERWVEAVSLATPAPVAIVHGTLDRPLRTVRVVAGGEGAAGAIAAELAAAVPARQRHTEGEVAIIAVTEWEGLAQAPPDGGGLVLVPDGLVPARAGRGGMTRLR